MMIVPRTGFAEAPDSAHTNSKEKKTNALTMKPSFSARNPLSPVLRYILPYALVRVAY